MPSSDPNPTPASIATAAHLEHLSYLCTASINARDWNYTASAAGREFIQHVDTVNFISQFDGYPRRLDWQQQNEAWKAMLESDPAATFKIVSMSASIDQKQGIGIVLIENETDDINGVNLRGLTEAKFRRKDGKWLFYHMIAMKGPGSSTGL